MIRQPPRSTRTYTLLPYTTLVRSNHLIHPASRGEAQIVTDSSRARQERGDEIIDTAGGALDPLTLLWDRTRPALPIYRKQPDDPDNENTLATAVFEIGADRVAWRVYDRCGQPAQRSDERRGGRECVSTCRSRWSQYQ